MDFALVLPHQLFWPHPAVKRAQQVLVVEEPRFFSEFRFHQTKLTFHRASMRRWSEQAAAIVPVEYIDHQPADALWETISRTLHSLKCQTLWVVEPADTVLEQRIIQAAQAAGAAVQWLDSPAFICRRQDCHQILGGLEHYSLTSFYIVLRKRFAILLDKRKPVGGKWTYDVLNRRKLPKDVAVPLPVRLAADAVWQQARQYVRRQFASHPAGDEQVVYPTSVRQAQRWLADFLEHRFAYFGPYQDAIDKDRAVLFHSVLSPLLNSGLLLPMAVIQKALRYAQKHSVPLESVEGFVRQILGWREFIRALYVLEENRLKHSNYWGHTRPLPAAFYKASTGIEPVDTVIRRVMQTAYCHHIERLMVVGAFMLLCRISPMEVYRWFMELFIDAYDWVMTPNVLGMSQFAAGGLMTTKPYVCASHYILKMSNFAKGSWTEVWDALFWDYLQSYRQAFKPYARLAGLIKRLEALPASQRQRYRQRANAFLAQLT